MKSIAKDLNIDIEMKIFADACAILGTIAHRGICKTRPLDTNYLWGQEMAAKKKKR